MTPADAAAFPNSQGLAKILLRRSGNKFSVAWISDLMRPCFPPGLRTGMVAKTPFEELVTPHLQAAFNLAYWIVRSREEAEDVVQDAYLRAFRAFAGFRGAAAKPWLLAIVRNVAYRALQKRKRSATVIFFSEDLKH